MMHKHFSRRSGFTMLELIVVLVIMSIMIVGLIHYDTSGDMMTHNDAHQLAADIRYAQSLSMTHADNYSVLITDAGGGNWEYQIMLDTTPQTNPTTGKTDPVLLQSDVAFSAEIAAGEITFDGRGVPYGDADLLLTTDATITLSHPDEEDQVIEITPNVGHVEIVPA